MTYNVCLFHFPLVEPDPTPPAAPTGTINGTNHVFIPGIFWFVGKERLPKRSCFLPATDKVALLIGNLNYSQHPGLMAPVMDVHKLANLLRQLGFRVVSLLDLTKDEMLAAIERFIQLLNRGVYGEKSLPSNYGNTCRVIAPLVTAHR